MMCHTHTQVFFPTSMLQFQFIRVTELRLVQVELIEYSLFVLLLNLQLISCASVLYLHNRMYVKP
jgi:hypothetical protein